MACAAAELGVSPGFLRKDQAGQLEGEPAEGTQQKQDQHADIFFNCRLWIALSSSKGAFHCQVYAWLRHPLELQDLGQI
jgi:hypothetical protein